MPETVDGSDEVILGLRLCIAHYELVEHGIVGIGKEDGLDVGIVHPHVLHTVFLLVATCEFVLLNLAGHVVIDVGSDH